MGLYADSSGRQLNTTRPGSAETRSNCISPATGGGGSVPAIIARRESMPVIDRPVTVLGPGSYQVTVCERSGPHPVRAVVSVDSAVTSSPWCATGCGGGGHDRGHGAGDFWLPILRS